MSKIDYELKKARRDKPVIILGNRDIFTTLAYCINLIGIRAENIPTDIEKKVIAAYLRKYFGTTTAEEIKFAFELAIAGQLNLTANDVNAYENFTVLYIAKILNAYKSFFNANILPEKTGTKTLPPPGFSSVDIVNTYYQSFLAGDLNWKTITERAYDIAFEHCKMQMSESDIMQSIEAAKKEVMVEYKLNLKNDNLKQLCDIPLLTVCAKNFDVNRLAKIKLLKLWFERLKSNNYKMIVKN